MANAANLIQRLVEIQSGARHRSPALIAEDEQLMDSLRRNLQQESNPAAEPPNNGAVGFKF
jgi:hypothetical protein